MASKRVLIGRDLRGLKKGDLVEFKRALGLYSHWGVYIGDQTVIHVTGASEDVSGPFSISGVQYEGAEVVQENIFKIADGGKFYKNNWLDGRLTPGTPDEIVAYAKARLGPIPYNVFTKNCEHLVTSIRYTVERSGQVEKFLSIIKKIQPYAAEVAQAGRTAVNKVRGRNYNQAQGGAF